MIEHDDTSPPTADRAAAFAAAVEDHWPALHRLLFRMCGNADEAADLTQEAFTRALERWSSFRPGTNLRAWLMRIAANALIDWQRKRTSARNVPLEHDAAEPGADPGQPAESAELGALLEAAIAQLPETARLVFVLRTVEELPFAEIAEILGGTEETARWHLHQARARLVKRLEGRL